LAFQNGANVWGNLGAGCDAAILDLLFDGDKLYVGGQFTQCGGVPGTRSIAQWQNNKWSALNTGINSGATINAMIKYNGKLYVGGSSTGVGGLRTGGGLYTWDGNKWENVYARCQFGCAQNIFTTLYQPTSNNNFDPLSARVVSSVTSMRVNNGNLYMIANQFLVSYDGAVFNRLGSFTNGASCLKQGCIAVNSSDITTIGFNDPAGYNLNSAQYSTSANNWVETNTGFEVVPTFIAGSATQVASLALAIALAIIAYAFSV